jgi:hypothetical protein
MGKTGTVLADFELLRRQGLADTLIVVCPNSLKYAWQDAICDEWNVPAFSYVYEASKRKQVPDCFRRKEGTALILIINYDSLAAAVDYGYFNLFDPRRAMIAFDQSTEIKNHGAQRTKAALKLARSFAYKRVLAGKPTSNGNHELWAQLKVIDATAMGFYGFRNTFCVLGGYMGKQVVGEQNTAYLRDTMAPHCFIAGDKYLAEFEPKIYAPIRHVGMTPNQTKAYKQMEKDFLIAMDSGDITAAIALTKYLRLQQISSGFATSETGMETVIVEPHFNPRLKEVYNIIKEEVENKVIVFYKFQQSYDWLEDTLAEFNPATIKGGMRGEAVEAQKRLFNTDPNCKVLIAQIEVAKMGHTLPGTDEMPCDTIIFYENNYSLITRSECEARPEKMGRKIPIEVIDLVSSAMDKEMVKALQKKENAAMALMGYSRKHGVLHSDV